MPLHDGTGPLGIGPGTGRKKGPCRGGYDYSNFKRLAFGGKGGWLFGLAAPVVIAAVQDLMNPSGMIRTLGSMFFNKKNNRILKDTGYTVVKEHSGL